MAQRVHGVSADAGWWSRFGIALGAVLARSGPLAALTQMLSAPPVERPSRIKTFVASLSQPNTAMKLLVLAVLALALGPLAVHAARWAVLRVRFGSLDEQVKSVDQAKNQLAMYKALVSQNTWPMTKLLADIASNTPEGIDLESIKVDRGSEFSVQGTSRSVGAMNAPQVVAKMQDNLNSTRIFSDTVYSVTESNNMGVFKFKLSGKVAQPFRQVNYDVDRDFQVWSLQQRQNGDPRPTIAKNSGNKPKPDAGKPSASQPTQTGDVHIASKEPREGDQPLITNPRHSESTSVMPVLMEANPKQAKRLMIALADAPSQPTRYLARAAVPARRMINLCPPRCKSPIRSPRIRSTKWILPSRNSD